MRTHALAWVLSLGVVAAWLGGCAGVVVIHEPVYPQDYSDGDFENATLTGELRTTVMGSPFGAAAAGDGLTAATTKAMHGANRGRAVDFTPRPTADGSGGYHVVMLFNPGRNVSPYDLCAEGTGLADSRSEGALELMSGFCFHDRLLSTVSGSVAGVRGPDDPAFRSLVRQVTLALFPAYDRKDVGDAGASTP